VIQQLKFSSIDSDSEFELLSGDTGLFEAFSIGSGTYKPTKGSTGSRGLGQQSRGQITRLVANVSTALNSLFDDSLLPSEPSGFLEGLRTSLRQGIAENFDSDGLRFETEFGVNFEFEDEAKPVFQFGERDAKELVSNLKTRRGITAVKGVLFQGRANQDGLIHRLLDATTQAEKDVSFRMLLTNRAIDFLT